MLNCSRGADGAVTVRRLQLLPKKSLPLQKGIPNRNCICSKSNLLRVQPCRPRLPSQQVHTLTETVTVDSQSSGLGREGLSYTLARPDLKDQDGRLCVKSLTLPELQRWFASQGERPSRADQLWRWIYGRRSERLDAGAAPVRSAAATGSAAGAVTPATPHPALNPASANPIPTPGPSSTGDIKGGSASAFAAAAAAAVALQSNSGGRAAASAAAPLPPPSALSYLGGGGGLRHLADAREVSVDGFSAAFMDRFSHRLSLDGGLQLEDVTTASDGTRKLVFRVTAGEAAGGRIETVLIPWYRDYDPRVSRQERPRYTLCVSSQVGCAMNCQFCFTGRRGLLGNLSTGQIIEQVLVSEQLLANEAAAAVAAAANSNTASRAAPPPVVPASAASTAPPPVVPASAASTAPQPPPITNLVFMGMGEPLHNSEAVFAAIDVLTHRRAFGMSAARITLSTVGLLPQLQHFLDRYAPQPQPKQVFESSPSLAANNSTTTTTSTSTTTTTSTSTSTTTTTSSTSTTSSTATTTTTTATTTSTSTLLAAPFASASASAGGGGPGSCRPPTSPVVTAGAPARVRASASAPARKAQVGGGAAEGGGQQGGCQVEPPRVSLAVSIHAGTDELRTALVPSNTRLTLGAPWEAAEAAAATAALLPPSGPVAAETSEEGGGAPTLDRASSTSWQSSPRPPLLLRGLGALCGILARHYPRTDQRPLRAGRYVLFEYTMLGGVNDRPEDATALLEATRDIECSFNLIMFNPFPDTLYKPSTPERVAAFQRVLREGGRIVHVRRSKGDSDMAACGQLGDVGTLAGEGAGGSRGRPGARMLPEAIKLAAAAAAETAAGTGPVGTAAAAGTARR